MANRGGKNQDGRNRDDGGGMGRGWAARVLCVEPDPECGDRIRHLLEGLPVSVVVVESVEAARRGLAAEPFDVLLVDAAVRGAFELARERSTNTEHGSTIFLAARPTVALTVRAMRCGAMDVLRLPLDPDELLARLDAAVQRSVRIRQEDRRVERLERMCRRLASTTEQTESEGDASAPEARAKRRATASGAPAKPAGAAKKSPEQEFAASVRRELDVENLLRLTLEWLLAQTGPTNAAVYLPTGHDDYSLGAYVNYDLPKEASDFLLDHLADAIPARFERLDGVHHITSHKELERHLGEAAALVHEPNAVIFPCIHRGECLAVVALFRTARTPYADTVIERIRAMRPAFAEQLARVIRIHNRHKDEQWLGFDVDTGDANSGTDPLGGEPDFGEPDNRAA